MPVKHAAGGVNVVVKGPIIVRDRTPVEEDEEACEEYIYEEYADGGYAYGADEDML